MDAASALARLDFLHLEALEASARHLCSVTTEIKDQDRREFSGQLKEAEIAMELFARVIEATRENLDVLNRLQQGRQGLLEYTFPDWQGPMEAESRHGNN